MPNFFEPRDQYEPKRLAEKKHAKKPLIAAAVTLAVLVFAFAGISSWGLYAYDRVYPGVSAGGIGVSGLSREELESRL
ncbi:MAG: hypothetical protein Q8878_08510, partial [Bacillota bacterium]|nr:hypothetical protein [Bacillota bacterium]